MTGTEPERPTRFRGRARVVGDDVNTDDMYPGFAMRLPVAEAATHMFDATRRGWSAQVEEGDVVVAGRNFGIGSSRPVALLFLHLGVRALLAEQVNSLFMRNCINYGLPVLTVAGITGVVSEGDEVDVDLVAGAVTGLRTGERLAARPLPEVLLRILRCGGLMNQLERDGHLALPAERSLR